MTIYVSADVKMKEKMDAIIVSILMVINMKGSLLAEQKQKSYSIPL